MHVHTHTVYGMYYPVYRMVHIKDPLLLIKKKVAHEVVALGFLSQDLKLIYFKNILLKQTRLNKNAI